MGDPVYLAFSLELKKVTWKSKNDKIDKMIFKFDLTCSMAMQ